jgi:hypothetical protein
MLAALASLLAAGPASAQTVRCLACGGLTTARTYTHVVTAAEASRFIGWAKFQRDVPGNAMPRYSEQAWRWDNSHWTALELAFGDVYVYPYATGWSWVWRSSTGWLAVQSSSVIVRRETRSCSTPPATTDWSYSQDCLGVMF